MKKRILIALIVLSGVFFYKGYFLTRFYPSQFGFFVFFAGCMGSILLYKKDKLIGCLGGLFSFSFLKTFLFQDNTNFFYLYKEALIGFSILLIYYVVREMDLKEEMLKWFLVPIGLNIVLILIQKFDGNILGFMPVENFTGFLGNPSVTSTYIVLSAPLFLRYYPKFFWLLVVTSIICHSRVPFTALIASSLVYLWYENKRLFKKYLIILLIGLVIFFTWAMTVNKHYMDDWKYWFKERGSMVVGTMDGIKNNPILGWGVGSFEPIFQKIPMKDSYYLGTPFSVDEDPSGIPRRMHHPHNIYLYGWWTVGIGFIFLLYFIIERLFRKFTRENVLPFSILVGGMVLGIGYFFCYPVWLFLIVSLGIYHNQQRGIVCQKAK